MRPGEIARERGLSPNLLESGSFLTCGSEGALVDRSDKDSDLSLCGYFPSGWNCMLEVGEASTFPNDDVRGGVLGFPILDKSLLSYA